MARRYSGKHGKHGSKRPFRKTKPTWVRYDAKEVEKLIIKLAKEEKVPSQIGLVLRDTYGIPNIKEITNKNISKILNENKLLQELPEDLMALIKKQIKIIKHLESHKKDMPSKRGLQLTESKIQRLIKYYKKTNRLPDDWKYDREKVKLIAG
ncbi:MAG: 30S ribosomal protein S15 [Nanoarchaeota archaeon]